MSDNSENQVRGYSPRLGTYPRNYMFQPRSHLPRQGLCCEMRKVKTTSLHSGLRYHSNRAKTKTWYRNREALYLSICRRGHKYVRAFSRDSMDEATIRPGTSREYMGIQWWIGNNVAFFQFRIDYSLNLLICHAPETQFRGCMLGCPFEAERSCGAPHNHAQPFAARP